MNAPQAEDHLGLVHLCANRFRNRGIAYEELYSAGCMGLLKAVKAFDAERGVQFSTYAVPVILGEIKRLFRDGGSIRVSRSLREQARQLQELQDVFEKEHGREATLSELHRLSGLSEETIAEALCAVQQPLSLSGSSEEEGQIWEIPVPAPDIALGERLALRQAVAVLPKADRQFLQMRYGQEMTQCQIAKALGISQVQVSRREKKLLGELRRLLDS